MGSSRTSRPVRPVSPRNLAVGTCPACGRQQYTSRREARRAARAIHPDQALRAYPCGQWWHIGHTAGWRRRGEGS